MQIFQKTFKFCHINKPSHTTQSFKSVASQQMQFERRLFAEFVFQSKTHFSYKLSKR
jgi:hypothetical protein